MPYVVLMVLDGARPEYFDVPNIPHVQALIKGGTRYTNAFAGILESETPSGHASIGTGSEPGRNGILSFWWADSRNVKVDLFDPTKIRDGDLEKIISQNRVPTLAGQVHAKNAGAKVVALSGSKYYAADAIGGPDADMIMYFYGTADGEFVPTFVPRHAPPKGILNAPGLTAKSHGLTLGLENHLAMRLAATTFEKARQQVTMINLPEFDWPLGHVDGGVISMKQAETLMQSFDRDLAMLQAAYERAGVLDKTIFVMMADHGMMPLSHRIPETDIQQAVERAGGTTVTEAYSSGTYVWLKDSSRALQAARHIAALKNPLIQSVYANVKTSKGMVYERVTSGALQRAGGVENANQYLLQTFNGPNGPDIVVSLAEGVGIEPGGQASWKGDHGGLSWQAQHLPLVLSGPGIRANHVSSYPARLIDVAPTLLGLLGASHKGMQGTVLADALMRPTSVEARKQKALAAHLVPVVQALQRESALETAAHL